MLADCATLTKLLGTVLPHPHNPPGGGNQEPLGRRADRTSRGKMTPARLASQPPGTAQAEPRAHWGG